MKEIIIYGQNDPVLKNLSYAEAPWLEKVTNDLARDINRCIKSCYCSYY